MRDHIRRATARIRHAHIQRRILREREPTLRLIELHGGNTKVHHDAIDLGHADRLQQRHHRAEAACEE